MAKTDKDNILVRLSSIFFVKWRFTLLLWVTILALGTATYTSVIKREGFPAIQFPLSVVQGTYFVDDVEKVDADVLQPLSTLVGGMDIVDSVTASAGDNFFSAEVNFIEGTDAETGTEQLQTLLDTSDQLPSQITADVVTIDPASFLNEYDLLLSVYSTNPDVDVQELEGIADFVAVSMTDDDRITKAEPQYLTETAENPQTGVVETRQTKFNRIGVPSERTSISFYPAVTVGLDRDRDQIDILELSELVNEKLQEIDLSELSTDDSQFFVRIGADFAESITTQISSLQSNLVTGLLAVAVVSFLLITWRASIITGLFMVTVMVTTVGILYLIGYTLNTITLFALVLSLGLFVDDATIVVEAIDANKKKKRRLEVVQAAIRKIGAASFAGTFTTVLVFLPLAFLTGILGEFIRIMPITVIIALITSLTMSLTIIPLLSRFVLLRNTTPDLLTKTNPIPRFEAWLSRGVGALPRLLKTRPGLGKLVAIGMVLLSIGMFMAAGTFANKLELNIFPPTKDSDQIGFQIAYPEGYTLEQAQEVADTVNGIVSNQLSHLTTRVTYGSFDQPNARNADALIELISFNDREEKSPELITALQTEIDAALDDSIAVRVIQYDAGPPLLDFPLQIQVTADTLEQSTALAAEVEQHIMGATLERSNGTTAMITDTRPPEQTSIIRVDGARTLTVQGRFSDDDVSALLVLAEDFVKEKFTEDYLTQNGYPAESLGFDFGQESDNAESFASLAWAFPIALVMMYVLLGLQFRSFLQPLLIFMAIPFTFFGVFLGLYVTDNPLSFFVQVGLIGLIGIAVNNTILLTDYANQERRAGLGMVDSIANAATKRFRPLVTTTITTVVALLPLALSDPFWEALAYTIIFGLVSSTFLVILSFPYYYLGAEWLRSKVRRRKRATS